MMHNRGADTPVLAIIMVGEDCSNLMRLNASILTVLAATQYRQNWRVKAKGRSTCSTLLIGRQSLTYPIKTSFSCGECLLQIPCWLFFFFFFTWGVSVTDPMLVSFLCGEFLLRITCCLQIYVRIFSYTSRAGLIFMWGFSLTHPMLASVLRGEYCSYTSHAAFIFIWVVSFIHPVLASLLCGKVSLTHPVPASFSFFSFFFFFFYICSAGSILMWGVSFTIPCWLL